MRTLASLALLAAAIIAAPASAQIDKGCYNYSGQNVWTAKDAAKLRADIDCFVKAKGLADISIANREKRIAQLVPVSPPVGDVAEPELGKSFDKVLAPIASNFPTAPLLQPSWGTGAIAESGAQEKVGAFRFDCVAGPEAFDDPIVFPGQPGKSHWHQFFGNTKGDAFSTYKSLRESGDSTCVNPLIRSLYWSPMMLDGKGNGIRWYRAQIYYKRAPEGSAGCVEVGVRCAAMPAGMRFIFGYDMVTGKTPTGAVFIKCVNPNREYGVFSTLADVAKVCSPGLDISITAASPSCWDGKRLDSPNHRDHVAYAGWGDTGKLQCPKTHPIVIPQFSQQLFYRVMAGDTPALWSFSSDDMTAMGMGKLPGGTTFHADFMEAEDEGIKNVWVPNCINLMLSCNGGDLGNGTQLKDTVAAEWKARPRLVPIPVQEVR